MGDIVYAFDPEKFNPVSPLGSNLLFALPNHMLTQKTLAQGANFVRILEEEGIVGELTQMSVSLIEGLTATFGADGTDHPLFRRLNMDDDLYHQLRAILAKWHNEGATSLSKEEFALMLTVPFAFSAEQFGPSFSEDFKDRVLEIRKASAQRLVAQLSGLFETIDPKRYIPVMTVLGNAIFGRISNMAGGREKQIEDIVVKIIEETGLRRLAAQSIFDLVTTQGGENLPGVFRERIAFSRAGIKKPDILILGNALASHDSAARAKMRERISTLMPDATKIFIETRAC